MILIMTYLFVTACTPPHSGNSGTIGGSIVPYSEISSAIKSAMALFEPELPETYKSTKALGDTSFVEIISSPEVANLIESTPQGHKEENTEYGLIELDSNIDFQTGNSAYTGNLKLSVDNKIVLNEKAIRSDTSNGIIKASAVIEYSDYRIHDGILVSLSVRLKASGTGIGVIFDSLEYKGEPVANIKAIEDEYNQEYQNKGLNFEDPSDVLPAMEGEAPDEIKIMINEMFTQGQNKYLEGSPQPIEYEYQEWNCKWNLGENSSFEFEAEKGSDIIKYAVPVADADNENLVVKIDYSGLTLTMRLYEIFSGPDLLAPYMTLIERSIHDAMESYELRKNDWNGLKRTYYNSYDWSIEGGTDFHWISTVNTESSWGVGNDLYRARFKVLIESPLAGISYSFDVTWFLNEETALPIEFEVNGSPSGQLLPEKYLAFWP